jgi:gliding motility-associated-like protein
LGLLHFDSAFDLEIADVLPSELIFNTASDGGLLVDGRISWPILEGPVLYGETFTYSLTALFNECPSNGVVVNNAYANSYGYARDSIGALSTFQCGVEGCLPPTSLTLTHSSLEICEGSELELQALQVGGSAGVYNYSLYRNGVLAATPNTTGEFTISQAGTYYVKAVNSGDGTCFFDSDAFEVVVHQLPTYTVSGGGEVCEGETLPSIIINLEGTSPWTLEIDGVETEILVPEYTILPTDANIYLFDNLKDANCPQDISTEEQTVNVSYIPLPEVEINAMAFGYCGTSSDVTIELTAPASADFVWHDGTTDVNANSSQFINAPEGIYSVSVTDGGCKTVIEDITVNATDKPTYTISGGGIVCEGEELPAITVEFVGTAPWEFTMNDGTTVRNYTSDDAEFTVPDLIEGTYSISYIQDAGCEGDADLSQTTQIIVNPLPIVEIVGLPAEICDNADAITLTGNQTTGTNEFTWDGGSGNSFDPTGLSGTYTITYYHKDATTECENIATKDIEVNEHPTATVTTDDQSLCVGSALQIEATAMGGSGTYISHQWSDADNTSTLTDNQTQNPVFLGSNPIGVYELNYVVTDNNGCSGTDNVTITVTGLEQITFPALNDVCAGTDEIELNMASPQGGVYSGTGVSGNITDGFVFNPSSSAVELGGDFIITYTYAEGTDCEVFETQTINVTPSAILNFAPHQQAYCEYDGAVSLLGFTPSDAVLSGPGISGTSFNPQASDVVTDIPFNIYLTKTVNGCEAQISSEIIVHSRPVVSFDNLEISYCSSDANVLLNASPWNANATLSSNPLGLISGNEFLISSVNSYGTDIEITYRYTDATTTCASQIVLSTVVNHTPTPTTQDNSAILGEPTPALTATGENLVWYADDMTTIVATNTDTYTPNETAVGVYTYYVTQTLNGCTSDFKEVTLTITDCISPRVVIANDFVCAGTGSKELTASSQTPMQLDQTYRWYDSNNQLLAQTTTYEPVLVDGVTDYNYRLVIYDLSENCEGPSTNMTFRVEPLPQISFELPDFVCENGAEISLVGSHPDGTFTGDGVNGAYPNFIFNPSDAGVGIKTITYTAESQTTGCINTIEKDIEVIAPPTINMLSSMDICINAGNTELEATPISGTFSGIGVTGNEINPITIGANNSANVTYTFTDATYNCTNTQVMAVNVRALPIVSLLASSTTTCVSGTENQPTITLTGTPVSGTYSGDNVSGNIFTSPSISGSYEVYYTFTEATTNCENTASVTIEVKPEPEITINPIDPVCMHNTGPVSVSISNNSIGTVSFDESYISSTTLTLASFRAWEASAGQNPITYRFTESGSACVYQRTANIEVVEVAPPVVTPNPTNILIQNQPAQISADGENIRWYNTSNGRNGVGAVEGDYTVSEFLSPQQIQRYATQTIDGCESPSLAVEINLINCPAVAPVIAPVSMCEGDDVETLIATPDATNPGDNIYWFATNNTTETPLYIGENYTPTTEHINGRTGAVTFYAASKLDVENCFSAPEPAQLTINLAPQLNITGVQDKYCINSGLVYFNNFANQSNAQVYLDNQLLPGGVLDLSNISAGLYNLRYEFTSANACVAIAEKEIEVVEVPSPVAPTSPTMACANDVPQPIEIAGSTDYTFVWRRADMSRISNQTANTYTPSVTAADTYYVSHSDGLCESPLIPVLYTVNAPPPTANVIPDDWEGSVCIGNAPEGGLKISDPNAQYTYLWRENNGEGTVVNTGTQFPNPQVGVPYFVEVQDDNTNCKIIPTSRSYRIETIAQVDRPITQIVTSQTANCQSSENYGKIVAHGMGSSFEWYLDTTLSAISTNDTLQVSLSQAGQRTYYVRQKVGNCFSPYASVNFEVGETPDYISIAPISGVCSGDDIPLTAMHNGRTLRWYDRFNNQMPYSGNTIMLNEVNAGNHLYYATTYNSGCKGATDTIRFNVNLRPIISDILGNDTICIVDLEDEYLMGIMNFETTSYWIDSAQNSEIEWENSILSLKDHISEAGLYTYYLHAHNAYCETVGSKTVEVFNSVYPKIVGKETSCAPDYKSIYGIDSVVMRDWYNWEIISTNTPTRTLGTESRTISIDWVKPSIDTLVLTQTPQTGCIGRDTMLVIVSPRPEAVFNYQMSGGEGQMEFVNLTRQLPIEDNDTIIEVSYHSWWNFGRAHDLFDVLINTDSLTSFTQSFDYGYYNFSLRVENEYGCTSSFYADGVEVDYAHGFYIPNAFVPNGISLKNKTFKPFGFNLKTYEMSIYDNWGNLLWYTNKLSNGKPSEGWDGRYNGDPMPAGVYTYKLKAEFMNNDVWEGTKGSGRLDKKTTFGRFILIR